MSRKIVHIGSGPIIPLAWWLDVSSNIAIVVASIITICLAVNYQLRLFTSIENIGRRSFGTILYGLSISSLLILFWENCPSAVTAGVLVMAFGDGLAGLIGPKIKSPHWFIMGQKKSVIGTLTIGSISALILVIINYATGSHLDLNNICLITSLAIALEQISPLGIDNLTVPLVVAISWQWMF
ncbi:MULTISPECIES: diacylglycerol/polyprenol kinase family protein [unclassified Prochlorococcus]|uniref:diacylglycerol/polyprenol kinase family protein n=1 Tax=unclassified Prochlorococcus TaxID=2627481 RepID=UPI001F4D2F59|nr:MULTISPECIES: dolichol kinase [unclassified Prochlorococcus]